MVRDNRHDSAYIFGAICPSRGVGAAMITPAANTEMMNLHLDEISTQVAPGACAVMLCDRAGWHQQGTNLRLPENIASSEESVGDVRLRQSAKCVIQRDFRDVEGAEAVGLSHRQFGLVVETLDHAAGELLSGAEVVQDQCTMRA